MERKYLNNIAILQFDSLTEHNLLHFSSTNRGGVSSGNYTSLNLGNFSDDSLSNITRNRQILCSSLNIELDKLITPRQTHSDIIMTIDSAFLQQPNEKKIELLDSVDSLMTNMTGVCIGINTADCVPILLYDFHHHALAAIHAGWKGTLAGLLQKTALRMQHEYGSQPSNLLCCIGPAISGEVYEVGDDLGNKFAEAGFDLSRISFRHPQSGKLHLDLKAANRFLAEGWGIPVEQIEVADLCTFSHPELFFSARRQGGASGRMLTGGMLQAR